MTQQIVQMCLNVRIPDTDQLSEGELERLEEYVAGELDSELNEVGYEVCRKFGTGRLTYFVSGPTRSKS